MVYTKKVRVMQNIRDGRYDYFLSEGTIRKYFDQGKLVQTSEGYMNAEGVHGKLPEL